MHIKYSLKKKKKEIFILRTIPNIALYRIASYIDIAKYASLVKIRNDISIKFLQHFYNKF